MSAAPPTLSAIPAAEATMSDHRSLIRWLLAVAGLVFAMVVVGGITRLTESGLSITEWKPVTGAIPPLSHADWVEAFEKYKQIPEYKEINGPAGMTLADFKFIFFWEWVHRLLGRVIGLAFALPLAFYWIKGMIPAGYKPRLIALLALGAMQGALGWYMVASGLADRTDVSHFRLSAHLLTALLIIGGLIWTALDLRHAVRARLSGLGWLALGLLSAQLLLGAWVAGLDAGYVTTQWPMMNDRLWPDGIDWTSGALFALTHDPFLLHWLHRWWAWVSVIGFVLIARAAKRAAPASDGRMASIALHSAFGTQILLGIATVLSGMHIILAVLHQAVGALVVASCVWCAHAAARRTLWPR